MPSSKRLLRLKNITEIARQTWSRIWPEPMPPGWKVYLVRKTVIQSVHGRQVCGVTLARSKTILVGRNTGHYSFETLVHELAHLRTLEEQVDHGPQWQHEFNSVARIRLGNELARHI
ncbi:MAG: hypothetical protein JO166_17780 [Deltaproteobacteria bacterium]|nr:hypothetical protein [Deltaproteobacteria bacterium]